MFFAKGEIIMNNIYKVIWSKAKNCYVVASEIAKSHTKSASGQSVRRSALASLLALSLLCGGLGVASAADGTVKVDESTTSTTEVYTKGGTESYVNQALTHFDTKTEVDNKINAKIEALTTTGDVATNKDNITELQRKTQKIDYDAANDTTSVNGMKVGQQVDMGGKNLTNVGTINGIDLGTKEGGNYISQDGSIWGNMKNVDTQVGTNAVAIAGNTTAITALDTKVGTVGTGDYLDPTKSVGENLGRLDAGLKQFDTKTEVDNKINAKIEALTTTGDVATNKDNITELQRKTQKIDYDAANDTTSVNGMKVGQQVDMGGKNLTNVGTINGIDLGTKEGGNYISQDGSIWGNMKNVDTQVGTNAVAIAGNTTAITALDTKVGTVGTGDYLDPTKSVGENLGRLDAGLKQEVADRKAAIGELAVDGNYIEKGKNVSDNLVKLDNQAKANADEIVKTNERTGGIARNTEKTQTTIEGIVKVDNQGNVKDVKGLSAETINTTGNATVGGDLKVAGTITTDKMVFGDKATNNYTEIDHGKVTSKNLEVNGAGETISSSSTFNAKENKVGFANSVTGEQSLHKQTSDVITDNVKNNITGDQSFHKQTSDIIMDNVKDLHNSNNRTQTKTETKDIITDENGNSSTTSQTASENKTYLKDKDGKNTNSTIDTAKGYDKTIKGENGETSTKQDELNITNTAQNGTITNDAQNIVNNASGNITNKANTMDTNVTGRATESYGSLDTTVNGNETHIVKGTKTETVDGMVTENYKAGQATNVTGNQTTNVSGTQTTTATDINRNASSSMVDKVDNAYGTNTETKEAGKTTTDVSIKGTGEKGQYIRGATESRDYLIKGTSTNMETKTAEATSTEITDGTNTASTIQDAKNLAGSVTNGTETGVSGIYANDDGSVSIDSAVAGGGMSSVINQKKDSIQSAVGDGTNSTVIHQDKDNVTIASSNGMVGLVGKDIVNNAQDTITNTAGTSITNQVNDSKVTTDANGTTFENNTPAVSDGGATTTKINGNQITTGRVNANELAVSDKDGDNTADLSVKAGEGVKASASDGTTTGSLDVTADEVGSTVKDASGKGSTFKQRIDKIMMESKDVSIKAEETLTNEAKVITNKASEVINNEAVNINNTATGIITSKASEIKNQADKLISNKVGENTWENMEDGKITTSIKDGTKQNLTQSDAAGTTQSTVDGAKSTVTIQNADGLAGAVTDGTNTSVQNQTASAIATDVKDGAGNENASVANATTSANTIKNGTKANTVISTADGTSFINSEAAAPVTGASGAGTAVNTTIKGNTITTGKVTMDYAEVMKDLGVHGSATVDNDLTVKGITNTKTLNVTEDASVGRDLAVGGNATIKGDVTARSYNVGGNTYIDADGIHANNQKITDVADGSISEGSKDAVNGGQLYGVKRDLEHQVDKVGANAAAMANLRPMEFDPSSKWNIAAAIGNYGSETAAALGAFYRPNDNVMVNLSTAFGTGENMVGGGVSVRLGKGGNKLSREETNALKAQVADLTARMDALLSVLNPNMSKDFPDVPENHWAYEAVSRLAGNDIVQGYPDGEFHGERTMTRYEMAEIIYNALSRGAEAEKELVEEFKPELQAMAASEKATAEKAEG